MSCESFPLKDDGEDSKSGRDVEQGDDSIAVGNGQAVALVVDAEVTSYLMMGALSPGGSAYSRTECALAITFNSTCAHILQVYLVGHVSL